MKKIKVGFIGAGWWATSNHMPLLKNEADVELHSVCCLGKENLKKVMNHYPFQFGTESYEEVVKQPLDALFVCSPHVHHYAHAKAGLENGMHVLCEKPMTLDGQEAAELHQLATEKGLHFLIPFGWNYKPFLQATKRKIETGCLGRLQNINCRMASPTKDFFAKLGSVPKAFDVGLFKPEMDTWQVKELGGGYAHGQLTHAFGLLFWLTPLLPLEVSARMTSPDSAVDLHNAATILFQDNVIGCAHGAGTLPDHDPFQIELQIFGEDGSLFIRVQDDFAEFRLNNGEVIRMPAEKGEGAYGCDGPVERFLELLRGESVANDSDSEVGTHTVNLINALFESASNGGKVSPVKNLIKINP